MSPETPLQTTPTQETSQQASSQQTIPQQQGPSTASGSAPTLETTTYNYIKVKGIRENVIT